MEGFKVRAAIVLFVLFLMSGYYSWQEMRYFLGGRIVDATVDQVEVRSERVYRRRYGTTTRHYQHVMLHFPRPDNTVESASLRLGTHQPIQARQAVKIQYLPGQSEMLRLNGSTNWLAIAFFFGSLATLVGMLVWVGMEANRPYGSARVVDSDRPVRATQPKKKKRVLKPLKPVDE